MMESLTPRTDVEAEENGLNRVVSADFARQLERELAEARDEGEKWRLLALDAEKLVRRQREERLAAIEQARNESMAEARRDAERYRWLRDEAVHFGHHDGTDSPWVVLGKSGYECAPTYGDELDAAIDAAMKGG